MKEPVLVMDSLKKRAWRKLRQDKWGMIAAAVVTSYLLIAVLVKLDLIGQGWEQLMTKGYEAPSAKYWFGTNINGQDIFKRAITSTKSAFEIGFLVTLCAVVLGGFLGSLAGFFRGKWVDQLITWFYGCLDSIPFYLFVAAVSYALKGSDYSMHVAMIATFWTGTARVVRGEVIKIKNLEYVEAARAIGVPSFLIIFRHILPNTFHLLLVQGALIFVAAIKTEVILSFLGLGVKDGISWGLMIAEASHEIIAGQFGNFLAASSFLFVLVMAFNTFADALQDALDPKSVSAS